MPEYNSTAFRPPAPVAHVLVKSPTANDIIANVPMLIDSGADVSLLPLDLIAVSSLNEIIDETHQY